MLSIILLLRIKSILRNDPLMVGPLDKYKILKKPA